MLARLKLWRINNAIGAATRRRLPAPNIETLRESVRTSVHGLRPEQGGEEAFAVIDRMVDHGMSSYLNLIHDTASQLNARLDRLAAPLESLLVRARHVHEHNQLRLNDLDAALMHALDRAAEPDTPYFDPRRPRTEQP
jgi:hypothetical protein